MELDTLLRELFQSQEDWSVTVGENTYVVVPNDCIEDEDEE
ncbi:hypothetical protein O9H85_05025 [Paenibacillus filicis]|uniref:Uncharacterized protein n=1 Tax=Paenibacillus gyeongsangnamensis TaxID=3388067 RepID=A0ABT4Q512_9BACL|nr:hypothetical protein [Paenibacillus filicis]MCZ8511795.1 hypothetical protein [Paenibacillus filicis]